ncbi:MAG: NAD-dependent dehydratase [Verrucomicrobia bacterium]|nr:MAG: NAD-dependent dehydratase [Verrucomicrobiota bacterium]
MILTQHSPSPTNPKRVVILGASGFVARDLARHLAGLGAETLTVGSAQVDLLEPGSVAKLQAIIRPDDSLVITSALTPEKGKDVRTFMKNLTMISQVCAFFEQGACAHVVYLSSDAVYDDSRAFVRETTPRTGLGLYGLMHAAREEMLRFALSKSNPPLCVVRPCAIYGAGDTHNSYGPNRFMRSAIKDRKITLFGNGEEQRDHVYIKDVSRFLGLCLQHRTEGAVNIVTGNAVSFYDLSQRIIKLCPHTVELECLPRATPITHRLFDISLRLKEFPGFQCTSLEAGLQEMLNELMDKGKA